MLIVMVLISVTADSRSRICPQAQQPSTHLTLGSCPFTSPSGASRAAGGSVGASLLSPLSPSGACGIALAPSSLANMPNQETHQEEFYHSTLNSTKLPWLKKNTKQITTSHPLKFRTESQYRPTTKFNIAFKVPKLTCAQ